MNRKGEGLKKQGRVEKKGLECEKKGSPLRSGAILVSTSFEPQPYTWNGTPRPIFARSPSSALLPCFFWEGSATKIDYRKRAPLF